MTTKSTHHLPLTAIAMVAILGLFGAAQALKADESIGMHSSAVGFRDLNLSTVEGATALYQRIKKAASQVCEKQAQDLYVNDLKTWEHCYRGAIDRAVAKVNSPLLTAVHGGQGRDATVTAMTTK